MNELTRPPAPAETASDFRTVRAYTDALCAGLSPEDQVVQSMPDASPAKWHRAHTTWFFEQFVLLPHAPGYVPCDDAFGFLFNSYYEALGDRYPRATRGLVTRPGVSDVNRYRAHVDRAMQGLLEAGDPTIAALVTLGLHHEQQHQELLVTDMLHALAQNPLAWRDGGIPVLPGWVCPPAVPGEVRFVEQPERIVEIGHDGNGFGFDNEFPRHRALLQPHALADRLVTNGEWLSFMEAGGYADRGLWMSDGASARAEAGWEAPMHWRRDGDGGWLCVSPGGLAPLDLSLPVRHISWYEADAYARFASCRLPTEFEMEHAGPSLPDFHGQVWQWTNSAYLPYPGFRPAPGAIGEYNGKFMINQMVLRGSSAVTSPGHARDSYRNFFPADKRWQMTGLRLARDL